MRKAVNTLADCGTLTITANDKEFSSYLQEEVKSYFRRKHGDARRAVIAATRIGRQEGTDIYMLCEVVVNGNSQQISVNDCPYI